MCHAAARRLEWAHHVQPPDGKGPSRHVLLGADFLAPLAMLEQVLGVFQSSRPEETMAESLGNK